MSSGNPTSDSRQRTPRRGCLRDGPKVLRGYRSDGSLNYDAIQTVDAREDIERPLLDLPDATNVHEVRVRALREQRFTYRVRRRGRSA